MKPEQWNRIQILFKELVDLDQDTQLARLESVKTDDPLLYEELISLLAADSEQTSLIDGFAIDQIDLNSISDLENVKIGPFQVEKMIGTGGMGSVYLAHRVTGGFEQTVALKLIKYGMGSKQAIRRFEKERNILARLQHPNIARLVDGGLTGEDHPWFAMEYVDGEDILSYSNRLNLPVEERLALFIYVTDAVHYAHKNLIVHRDIKPGNILITGDQNKPLVKLLDFGISQIMDESDSEQQSMAAMTRAYASPEQINGDPTSTSTDIYSLGVVLYQLITGCHPKQEFRSENCHSIPIDKELTAICNKAMQNDPSNRIQNASELGDEIISWLNMQPVLSYSKKPLYRFNKWVQRNRAASFIGIFAAISLIIIVLLYTFELQKETERAQAEAETSQQIAGFLQGLFEITDPAVSQGDTLTAFTMLERGTTQVEEDLQDSPEILARMYDVLGDAYASLWDTEKAEDLFKKALEIKQTIYDENHPEIGKSHHNIGNIYMQDGRYQEADSLMSHALKIRRQYLDPESPEIASTLQHLGFLKFRLGETDQAEQLYSESLSIYQAGMDEESALEAASLTNSLGMIYERRGDYDRAVENYRDALDYLRLSQEPDHIRSVNYLSNIGYALHLQGNSEEGKPYLVESIEVATRLRGEDHPHTAMAMSFYSSFLFQEGNYEESENITKRVLEIYIDNFGEDHPAIPVFYNNIGNTRNNLGDYEAALEYHQKALDRRIEIYGETHYETAQSYANIATTYSDMERYEKALEYYRTALDIELEVFGELNPETAYSYEAIGNVYKYMGEVDEAEQYYIKAIDILVEVLGDEHFETVNARKRLARLYEESGRE